MRPTILTLTLTLLAAAARAQQLPEAYEAAQAGLRGEAAWTNAEAGVSEAEVSEPSQHVDLPARPQPDMSFSDAMRDYFKTLPAYDLGKHGHPGSALTLIFIGTKSQINGALRQADWKGVPRSTPLAFVEGLGQVVAGTRLTKFPSFHNYKVEGKTQSANWAQVVHALSKRHHFRLWKLKQRDPYGRQVWWGSASLDTGIRWKLFIPVTHNTSPDIDAERDFIARTLAGVPSVLRVGLVTLPQIPRYGTNDQRDSYFTDGRALVVEFGRPIPSDAADPSPDEIGEPVSTPEGQ